MDLVEPSLRSPGMILSILACPAFLLVSWPRPPRQTHRCKDGKQPRGGHLLLAGDSDESRAPSLPQFGVLKLARF